MLTLSSPLIPFLHNTLIRLITVVHIRRDASQALRTSYTLPALPA